MKKSMFLIASLLVVITANAFAQNTVTISPGMATINIGETANFTVSLNVESGYDASVFLTSSWGANSVSPSIINYPYTAPATLSIKTFTTTKRGSYSIIVSAAIGGKVVTDTCMVVVHNQSPMRIFPAIFKELRPQSISVDKYGNIYYSTLRINADKLSKSSGKTTISNPNFDPYAGKFGNEVETWQILTDDNNNRQYLLTRLGLQVYKGKDVSIYNTSNSSLPNDTIKRGVIEKNGRLWLGTPNGLASFENYTVTWYDNSLTNSVLGNEKITSLAIGDDGRLWIGTPNGLVVKNGDTWTRYTPQNSGLPAPYIFGLVVDKYNVAWMGAGNELTKLSKSNPSYNDSPETMKGLVRFDGTIWTTFDSTNSPLSSNYVNGLSSDSKGNLWVATASNMYYTELMVSGCGLLKYDGTNWAQFTTSNSLLPDNDVQWVGTDIYDNVWFSCKSEFGVMNEDGIPFLVNAVEEQPEATDGITIFPNPTNTTFTISGADNVTSVKLMNSLGMEISRKSLVVSGKVEVDVADLANGIYFVQICTPSGMITKTIVVSR